MLPEQSQTSSVGEIIGGRYRLTKLLGQGGMGEVYAAEHTTITKRVAVKLLHKEISANQEAVVRFRQEAQSASSIGHENIIAIDDFGTMPDGRVYMCMEYLDGENLSERLHRLKEIPSLEAIDLMLQVCEGLGVAHAKGIVHRDMKPENVFISKRPNGTDIVKILDFGIAKVSTDGGTDNLTKTGTVFGTPHYMSPEQAMGQKIDHRADIYSVGVMLFELFTGQVPYKAESFMGILSQHITQPTPLPSFVNPSRAVPPAIEAIILRAMSKKPEERFSSMQSMIEALKAARVDIERSSTAGAHKPSVSPVVQKASVSSPAVVTKSRHDEVIPKTMLASQIEPALSSSLATAPETPQVKKKLPAKQKNRMPIILIVIGVLIAGGAFAIWGKSADEDEDSSEPVAVGNSSRSDAEARGKINDASIVAISDTTAHVATPTVTTTSATKTTKAVKPVTESASKKPTKGTVIASQTEPTQEPPTKVTLEVTEVTRPAETAQEKPDVKTEVVATLKEDPKRELESAQEKPAPKEEPKEEREFGMVKLLSVPSEARVFEHGKSIGFTPMSFKMMPGESRSFKLAKGGYADRSVTITMDDDPQKVVKLIKRSFIPGGIGSDDMPTSDPDEN